MTLLELISKQLNGVYHLGYLEFPNHTVGTVELPMALGGSYMLLSVSRSVLRRKSSALQRRKKPRKRQSRKRRKKRQEYENAK